MKFHAIFIYSLIIFSVLQGWLIISAVSIALFSFYYNTAFLIPFAILVDGYMGAFYSLPILSFLAVIWFSLVECLRPRFVNFKAS